MGDMSPNFSRREFDSHDGARADPHPELIRRLETLRRLIGDRPIHIVSGYRSPAHNARVGGARRSQHLFNRAADLRPRVATVEQARAAGFTGIGRQGKWAVHVDVRPGPRVEWSY